MNNTKGYYDFEIDLSDILDDCGMVEQMFYLKDVKNRKFIINSDIEQLSVADVVRHIMQINKEDQGIAPEERQPILLYLVSCGGEVDSGFELVDIIAASKTPVYTINLGFWYSMAFLIGIAGHKRYCTKNAKFLLHDGMNGAYATSAKMQDKLNFDKRTEERIKKFVLEHTSITEEQYDDHYRVEWYMYSEDAKECGCVDYIIGEDCDLDEII